jgi:hypothetical protein
MALSWPLFVGLTVAIVAISWKRNPEESLQQEVIRSVSCLAALVLLWVIYGTGRALFG